MRRYRVKITCRPHFNSKTREEHTVVITATNRDQAIFAAGYQLAHDGVSFVTESVTFLVSRV